MVSGWLVVLMAAGCAPSRPPLPVTDDYQEFFDVNLFHDQVRLLNRVSPGASQPQVLAALGEPRRREATPTGETAFIYRLRCYSGPELFSRWPRHLSVTYESRIIFDRQGRVTATQTKP